MQWRAAARRGKKSFYYLVKHTHRELSAEPTQDSSGHRHRRSEGAYYYYKMDSLLTTTLQLKLLHSVTGQDQGVLAITTSLLHKLPSTNEQGGGFLRWYRVKIHLHFYSIHLNISMLSSNDFTEKSSREHFFLRIRRLSKLYVLPFEFWRPFSA